MGDEGDGGRRENRERREMEEGLGWVGGRQTGRVTLPKRQRSQSVTLTRLTSL